MFSFVNLLFFYVHYSFQNSKRKSDLEDDAATKRTSGAIGTLKRIKYDNSFSNDVKKNFLYERNKIYRFSHQRNDRKIA
jgi:hypothetical protein